MSKMPPISCLQFDGLSCGISESICNHSGVSQREENKNITNITKLRKQCTHPSIHPFSTTTYPPLRACQWFWSQSQLSVHIEDGVSPWKSRHLITVGLPVSLLCIFLRFGSKIVDGERLQFDSRAAMLRACYIRKIIRRLQQPDTWNTI